ncbi:TetR/AcrR family transcriptional regulator [Petropleomorpha daqingensis]|uniref:AcrR family transcriptional regulator n=1 Tax=Petropleomorpha daqingensis TaxID=2026353 RepID=A0A853CHV1_9ACTN|nr:AcrR family transcriptional regulator [Petropleomorpha daqingensis]
MTGDHGERGRRRGRPQDPALADVIRAATVKVLADVGYRGLTMDEVALVAGVSKATIYRRWPSKVDLLVSVMDSASDATLVEVDTGSLREDLVALLGAMSDILSGPGGGVSRALIGVLDAEPALAQAYRQGPLARWEAAFRLAFRRAAERGEIAHGLEDSLAAASGPGIMVQAWLFLGQDLQGGFPAQVVDEVMLPLLTRPAAAPPPRPAP